MDYEATLRALHAWLGTSVAVMLLCGDPATLLLARIYGTLHSGHDDERTAPEEWPIDDANVFFAVTNPLVAHRGSGFFLLKRSFERAHWRDDDKTQLVIEGWMSRMIVLRVETET